MTARKRSPSPEEVQRAVKLHEAGQSTQVIVGKLDFVSRKIPWALSGAGSTIVRGWAPDAAIPKR